MSGESMVQTGGSILGSRIIPGHNPPQKFSLRLQPVVESMAFYTSTLVVQLDL